MEANIADIIERLYGIDTDVRLTRPEPQFGDYATSVALQLANKIGTSPKAIAEAIVAEMRIDDRFDEMTVAGPGFINFRLKDAALVALIHQETLKPLKGKKILVEYSDPNPLKPLHAGHLYTTLVGDTIARLVEQAGADTVRINYGGDVGLHTAKSMWAIIHEIGGEFPEKLSEVSESDRPVWLGDRYVTGNNAYEDDDAAKAEITAINKRIYLVHSEKDHDSNFAVMYRMVRGWSYDYFAQLYVQLQVATFDRFIPESEVTPLGLTTVKKQYNNGIYEKSTESEAIIFNGEKYGLHTRVFINSEGLPTYEAKDVGLSLTKWNDYNFDKSIIITANEQLQYMQVVVKSIEQFAPKPAERTKHLTHGVVKLQGGVKMSSRKGNIVTAMDILASARQAGAETDFAPTEETILAAIKYAFAKVRIGSDIVYDPKDSISLDGNSGPYLQYAHARAKSILGKSNVEPSDISSSKFDANERALLRKLSEYNAIISRATDELMPHYICTYLYELAQEFNRFYENSRIIGDERESIRLAIGLLYITKLSNGLKLLGIHAPDSM